LDRFLFGVAEIRIHSEKVIPIPLMPREVRYIAFPSSDTESRLIPVARGADEPPTASAPI